ncbi:hypothetical protein [Sulfurirhabdus autotrophica]|uniref:Uncharacterized protein n=1 Tax=Sulfurirhabdus autotrophica TaxID=1706046 RepID=A0A4R3YF91_9PROT|nr:hypothetical protein [Sulfurirhabdus autotrophica]TCV89574.1 hypothetical protein EDC63_10292 [Sulfurirhabdus autotrophica]
MRFTSNWVPPIEGVEETNEVKYVWSVLPAKRVGARLIPSLMMRRGAMYVENRSNLTGADLKFNEQERSSQGRRQYCRRVGDAQILLDTRAQGDRRRQKSRQTDFSTSIEIAG